MALFAVAPELRARGFQINLAGWTCHEQEGQLKVDSVAIFRLGPHKGIRLIHDNRIFGDEQPRKPDNCHCGNTHSREDDESRTESQLWHKIDRLEKGRGHGFPPTSYYPNKNEKIGKLMRKITFTVQTNPTTLDNPTDDMVRKDLEEQQAMDGLTGHDAILNLSRFKYDERKDRWMHSTFWPNDSRLSKHKQAEYEKHDPDYNLSKRGAHRPVLCYFGDNQSDKRSVVGKNEKQDKEWKL